MFHVVAAFIFGPPQRNSLAHLSMAASDTVEIDERAAKRVKRSEAPPRLTESEAGLLEYVHAGWRPVHAIIKERYADFLVHEIDTDGHVVNITSLDPPPKPSVVESVPEQLATWDDLVPYFGERVAQLQAMAQGASEETPTFIVSCALPDKADRTRVHQLIRTLASSLLSEATTLEDGTAAIRVERAAAVAGAAASRGGRGGAHGGGRGGRDRRRDDPTSEAVSAPPYIHFVLQKTNRDSQEAMHWLARFLKLDSRGRASSTHMLSVAGTKDKRAVTVQRVALQRGRRTLYDVWSMVNHIGHPISSSSAQRRTLDHALTTRAERGLRIAHLQYASQPLQLGDLQGNQFTIVLRNVHWADQEALGTEAASLRTTLAEHVAEIERDGFLNYFGMQRFGTGTIATHQIGIAVLRGDFHQALHLILASGQTEAASSAETESQEAEAEAEAPPSVRATRAALAAVEAQQYEEAYRLFPKTCVAERAVLEKMKAPHWSPTDPLGAFQNIPRTLRLMYVHAYQSYLWNRMVSERVRRFGATQPVVGDLVDVGGGQVRMLTDDDDLHTYTMTDVMMPMPGMDVTLPESGWLTDLYHELLEQDGLTPLSLVSSRQPEYRLKGTYRRMVHKPKDLRCEVLSYTDVTAPLCATDEERLLPGFEPIHTEEDEAPFLALKLVFQLPSSAYATMLLRELLRTDTSAHVHKALTKQASQ